LAADPVLAVAVMGGKIVGPLRPVLPPGWLSPQGTEAVRLVYLCHVQMVKAPGLLAQEAPPWLRAAAVHLALVSLARTVKAKHLPELLSRQEARVQVCLADQANPAPWPRPQPDSRQEPVAARRLGARPHESAAECSWDFLF